MFGCEFRGLRILRFDCFWAEGLGEMRLGDSRLRLQAGGSSD